MKIGDLVRYDTSRYENAAEVGVVIKVYHTVGGRVVDSGAHNWLRRMVDISFPYGVVADDSYEFEVMSENR